MWNYRPEPDTSGYLKTEGRQTSAGSEPPCAAQGRSQNAKVSLTGKQTHNSPLSSLQERGRGEGFRPARQRLTHSASTSIALGLGLGWGAVTSCRVPGCSLKVSKYVKAACSPVTWNMGPTDLVVVRGRASGSRAVLTPTLLPPHASGLPSWSQRWPRGRPPALGLPTHPPRSSI